MIPYFYRLHTIQIYYNTIDYIPCAVYCLPLTYFITAVWVIPFLYFHSTPCHPHSPLATTSLLSVSESVSILLFFSFVLFLRFHIQVRAYCISLSLIPSRSIHVVIWLSNIPQTDILSLSLSLSVYIYIYTAHTCLLYPFIC